MPLRDGTGPGGKGPRTGRGLGPCAPKSTRKKARKKSTARVRRKRALLYS